VPKNEENVYSTKRMKTVGQVGLNFLYFRLTVVCETKRNQMKRNETRFYT